MLQKVSIECKINEFIARMIIKFIGTGLKLVIKKNKLSRHDWAKEIIKNTMCIVTSQHVK